VPGGGVVVTPPSGSKVPPQKPDAAPGGIAQGRPLQQSLVEVHAMPCVWHWPGVPHTYGFVAFVAASVFGMHGLPQQSALDAHCVPAAGAPPSQFRLSVTVQRGMPFVSTWQVGNWLSLPAQQSAFVLHDIEPPVDALPGLQSAPAGLHTVET
jgi:hypothetical protein